MLTHWLYTSCKLACCIGIMLPIPIWSLGQDIPIKLMHYDRKSGLQSELLYEIVQDKYGFLWFSGNAGLTRFDGSKFLRFVHAAVDSCSLPNDDSRIVADKKGNIYVWSKTNIAQYDFKSRHFIKIKMLEPNASSAISTIAFDSKNKLWYATNEGSVYALQSNDQFQKQYSFAGNLVNAIFQDGKNRMWLGTDLGLFQFFPQQKTVKKITNSTSGNDNIFDIFEDNNGTIWASSWGKGLLKILPESQHAIQYKVPMPRALSNYLTKVIQPNKNQLWLSNLDATTGILVFNTSTNTFSILKEVPSGFNKAIDNTSLGFTKDKEGNIWIPTQFGAKRFHTQERLFSEINLNEITAAKDDVGIMDLSWQDNLLFVSSLSGLNIIDPTINKEVKHVLPAIATGISEHNMVNSVLKKNQDLLLGTYNGIIKYNLQNGKTQWLNTVRNLQIKKIIENKNGNLLVAHVNGLTVLSANADKIIANLLPGYTINNVVLINDTAWLASSSGLHSFDLTQIEAKQENYLTENTGYGQVNHIHPLNDSVLILSTINGVFLHAKKRNKSTQHFDKKDGLIHNKIAHAVSDKNGTIWLLSELGISSIDVKNKKIKNYSEAEGVAYSPSHFSGGLTKDDRGNIYFGSFISVNYFDPSNVHKNQYVAPLFFTEAYVDDSLMAFDLFEKQKKPFNFSYQNRKFSFHYAMLNFLHHEGNSYEYQLSGLDEKWHSNQNNHEISFNGLPPGKYTLKVRGKNNDGIAGLNEATLEFVILPPFWQTWWFRFLIVGGIISAVIIIFKRREKAYKAKAEIKHQLIEAEMKALRAQMNPHFIFNCLNSINRYIIKSDIITASDYLTKFSRLIRLILDTSAAELISLENETKLLKLYMEMEALRFDKKFKYEIDMDEKTHDEAANIFIPTLLIQPYVENAIWHGLMHKKDKSGTINLQFKKLNDSQIQVVIQDDGIGRQHSAVIKASDSLKKKSYGMSVGAQRLQLISGVATSVHIEDLYENEVPAGTRITLIIPFKIKTNTDD